MSAVLPCKWKWKWRGTPSTAGPFRFIPGKTRENRHLLHYLPSVPPLNEYIFIPIHIYTYRWIAARVHLDPRAYSFAFNRTSGCTPPRHGIYTYVDGDPSFDPNLSKVACAKSSETGSRSPVVGRGKKLMTVLHPPAVDSHREDIRDPPRGQRRYRLSTDPTSHRQAPASSDRTTDGRSKPTLEGEKPKTRVARTRTVRTARGGEGFAFETCNLQRFRPFFQGSESLER